MTFDTNDYWTLAQYFDSSKKTENKFDIVHDALKKAKFQKYGILISDNVHWQTRKEYFTLMKDFVNLKITGVEFEKSFTELHQANEKIIKEIEFDLEKLNCFPFHLRAAGFSAWTSELELGCDEFYPDFRAQEEPDLKFARDENNFRNFVADILPDVEQYLKE